MLKAEVPLYDAALSLRYRTKISNYYIYYRDTRMAIYGSRTLDSK